MAPSLQSHFGVGRARSRRPWPWLVAVIVAAGTLVGVGVQVATAGSHPITVTGQILCSDPNLGTFPLAGARVELYDAYHTFWGYHPADDGITMFDDHFGTSYTNADGTFSVSGDRGDSADAYVRIVLDDDQGVKLVNEFANDESLSSFHFTNPKYHHMDSGTFNLGSYTMTNQDPHFTSECAQFTGAKRAHDNYTEVTGHPVPGNWYTIAETNIFAAGVPWTDTVGTHWPNDYTAGSVWYTSGSGVAIPSVSLHEFGHRIRHSLDGDFGHFLGDVVTYTYFQQHTFCGATNEGFAFNEGWAEYWSNEFDTTGCTPNDMSQEGNVASSLKNLQDTCLTGTVDQRRAEMANVLANAGNFAVHSWNDYYAAFRSAHPACNSPYAALSSHFHYPIEGPGTNIPVADQITHTQLQITAANTALTGLNSTLQDLLNRKKSLGRVTCAGVPCQQAFDTLTLIPIVQSQIAQEKLFVAQLDNEIKSAPAKRDWGSPDTYFKEQQTGIAFSHKVAMSAYSGLAKARAAVQSLVATDASGQLTSSMQFLTRRQEALGTSSVDAAGAASLPTWIGSEFFGARETATPAGGASLSVTIASPLVDPTVTDPSDCLDPNVATHLVAVAIDPVAGALSGQNVTWTDTLNGTLGTGAFLTRPLVPPGAVANAGDNITVTATNAQGQQAVATVHVCFDVGGPQG